MHMTSAEKWNTIVELHKKERFSLEEKVQKIWENIFSEIFGYSTLFGDIDVQRSVQIGSTERAVTDIIIKDRNQDQFVVEIKQHTLRTGEMQLMSYLKLLHIGLGVLINDSLTLIAYDYTKQDDEQVRHVIHFKPDSSDGEQFVEMFSKPFQAEQAREFIVNANSMTKNIQEIRTLINPQYIEDILRADLGQLYNRSEIDRALGGIEIKIFDKEQKKESDSEDPIKGVVFRDSPKIGQAVQDFFSKQSRNNSLSEDMARKLCDRHYSKEKFSINRSVLIEIPDIREKEKYRKDSHGHARYYREVYRYNNRIYLLCSQWTTAQEPYFYQWVKFYEAGINV